MKTARETATQLGTVGVWSADPERMTAADARRFANEVESLGFKTLWIQESLGSKEVFAHAGILLAATKTLIVASGIANIWARDPVAMANGAKTLSEAYPDRFLLGLGVSHKPSVAIRGGTYRKPLEHMRAYLDAMDAAPFVGPNRDEPPAPRVLAALGPQMLRLAAERSLGAHPYFVPVEHTAVAREALGAEPLLAVEQAAVVGLDREKILAAAKRHTKYYLALENYANNLRRLGWSEADLADGGSEELMDAIVASGDARSIAGRVAAQHAAGADHVCLQMLGGDTLAQLRAIAKELR
ncbi:MAG TPA: TIGR03620 family F420-dependent LLM class oxidoreductase [Candidatus Limnocylindria bacterium]